MFNRLKLLEYESSLTMLNPLSFVCVGELALSGLLDRETTPSYELVIAVSDGGIDGDNVLSASATVSVVVLDSNAFSPQFHGGAVFQATVSEERTQNNIITVTSDALLYRRLFFVVFFSFFF